MAFVLPLALSYRANLTLRKTALNLYSLTLATIASLTVAAPALANSQSPLTPSSDPNSGPNSGLSIDASTDSNLPLDIPNPASQANSPTTLSTDKNASVDNSSPADWGWVDEERRGVQSHLGRWANTMNGWFGEPDPREPATANLRVIMDTRWEDDPVEGTHVTVEPRIRGRLRLPVLEKRLSLIIGDEALDNENVLTQDATGKGYQAQTIEQDKVVDAQKVRDNNASIALRWSRFSDTVERELGIQTDVDLGVRSGDDVFVKVSMDKDWYKDNNLAISSDNFYRYGSDSEHYAQSALNLQYDLTRHRAINNRTTLRYRHEDDDERTDWSNDLRQIHDFGRERQLSYGLSFSGDFASDKHLLNSYGPTISYRQPIWREWLYVQSELNYYNDKDEDKAHYPSALLRFEALF